MSILVESSVLVVGAGVSAPFGIPMGGDMITKIREGLYSDRRQIDGDEGRFEHQLIAYIRASFQHNHGFWKTPYFGTVMHRHFDASGNLIASEAANDDLQKLRKLIDLLDGQTSETIDDFLVENPSYSTILKACIAVQLMQASYTFSDRQITPLDFSQRHIGKEHKRNWVHLLINLVRQGIRTGELKPGNRVKIISFNYDGILEQILSRQFQNTGSSYGPYTDYFEIVHPHGLCGKLNQDPIKSAQELFQWSSNICVVNEADVDNTLVLGARATAKQWIDNASRVYAIGFAFSAPNCDLMGMRTTKSGGSRHLYYCNYNGSAGVSLAADKCKAYKHIFPTNGSPDKPISVEDWLYGGYLGEFSA